MSQLERTVAAYADELRGATTHEERMAAMERAAATVRDREERETSVFGAARKENQA